MRKETQATKRAAGPKAATTTSLSGRKQPYYGESLLPTEIAAIENHESAAGEIAWPSAPDYDHSAINLAHGAAPRLAYRGRVYNMRVACHLGQTKLGLGLIRLLAEHGHRASNVLYVGAAPGVNIAFVARLFPAHTFHLYDPAPFSQTLRAPELKGRVHLVQGLFTDADARKWEAWGGPLIFVSDIRTTELHGADFEENVRTNMAAQQNWYKLLGETPRVSMFKFRLPYQDPKKDRAPAAAVKYLAGELWLQPFASLSSTETRLVVVGSGAPEVEYDPSVYESELFWHNTVRREWGHFPHPGLDELLARDGYDGCYDCRAMAAILETCLRRQKGDDSLDVAAPDWPAVAELARQQAAFLGQSLRMPPHGEHPGLPMKDRRPALMQQFLAASRRKHQRKLRRNRDQARGRARNRSRNRSHDRSRNRSRKTAPRRRPVG